MKPELDGILDKVHDRASFLEFVKALQLDREDEIEKEKVNPSPAFGPGANGWENWTIEAFLDAMHAWANEPFDGQHPVGEKATWKNFARLLYAGKFME